MNELKALLVQSQWKQGKPEESQVIKQAHYNRMVNTIKRAVDRLGDIWKR